MVYRRKTYRKAPVRKRPAVKPSASVRSYVDKAISRSVETKKKVLEYTSLGLSSVTSGGSAIFLMTPITQGVGSSERIGDSIHLKGIRWYFPIQNGDSNNSFRFLLLQAKRGYPSTGSTTQVISDVFSSLTGMWQPVNTDKYKVITDKVIRLRTTPLDGTSATVIPDTKVIQGYSNLNRKFDYEYDSLAAAVRPTSELLMVAISDSVVAPNPGAIGGWIKLYFKDN